MAKYLTDELELQSVADAIRAKGGTSESLAFPTGFVSAIEDISTGDNSDTSAEDGIIDRTISVYMNSRVISIGDYIFYNASKLTVASFTACTSVGNSAFQRCYNLTTISFPVCTTIGLFAFSGCSNLTTISFPACKNVGNYAFSGCSSLTTISFPACTDIKAYAFSGCSRLRTISFPVCTNVGNGAFYGGSKLTIISFPSCTDIGDGAFYNCYNLTTASFPVCISIGNSAFRSCFNLLSLYLLGSSFITLTNMQAFLSTPIYNYTTSTGGVHGSIYVPASMLESYKTMTNWTYFSDRFVAYDE